jgi:hypothetical protein
MSFENPHLVNAEYKLILLGIDNEPKISYPSLVLPFAGLIWIWHLLWKSFKGEKKVRKLTNKIRDLEEEVVLKDFEIKKAKAKTPAGNSVARLLSVNNEVEEEEIADYVARKLIDEDYDEAQIYELTPLAVWASRNKLGEILTVLKAHHFHQHHKKLKKSLEIIAKRQYLKLWRVHMAQIKKELMEYKKFGQPLSKNYFDFWRERLTNLVLPVEEDLVDDLLVSSETSGSSPPSEVDEDDELLESLLGDDSDDEDMVLVA